MAFPKLFEFTSEEMIEVTEDLSTQTPLGVISISIKSSQKISLSKFSNMKVLKYKNALLFVIDLNDLYVEIIKLPIVPHIPKHMRIEECVAYLIRFKCLKKFQPEFVCSLEFADDALAAEPESGQRLMAQSFEHENTRLTIGTEDEESLEDRAKYHMWMPNRLFTDELISFENVECIKNGIKVVLPFFQNEMGQIQFVISWSRVKNNDPASTWFAVETSSEEILKQVSTCF
jgi:hypothetical protein